MARARFSRNSVPELICGETGAGFERALETAHAAVFKRVRRSNKVIFLSSSKCPASAFSVSSSFESERERSNKASQQIFLGLYSLPLLISIVDDKVEVLCSFVCILSLKKTSLNFVKSGLPLTRTFTTKVRHESMSASSDPASS